MIILKRVCILSLILIVSACTSYTQKDVEKRYIKLSNNLDILMDDEIEEKRRAKLEKEYSNFIQGMENFRYDNSEEDTEYLNSYIKNSKIKLQYLRDLKD